LNSNSPTVQPGDQVQDLVNEEPGKKRRIDNDATRTLLKPSGRKLSKRQRMPILLPSLQYLDYSNITSMNTVAVTDHSKDTMRDLFPSLSDT
jgi:hypothetical protein